MKLDDFHIAYEDFGIFITKNSNKTIFKANY